MARPLNEFGGWLRFFHVLAGVNFLTAAFLLGAAILFLFSGSPDPSITRGRLIIAVAVAIPFAVLMAAIYVKLPVQYQDTPRTIARHTWAAMVLIFLSAFMEAAITAAGIESVSFVDAYEWPNGVFWLLTFVLYLERSKRVKAFYGVNYPERDENTAKYLADPMEEMIEGWKNRPGKKK